MQVTSTTNATKQFDGCEQSSSWSALSAMIKIIKDTNTIDIELNKSINEKRVDEWKARVNMAIAEQDVNESTEELVRNVLFISS